YNKLRTLEIDVKGGSSYDSRGTSAPTHSAFISAASTNSKMSYPDQSHSTTFTSASSNPQQQITYEDFDQIGKMDLEELDIKWQMATLSVRINKFEKKAGRKMKFNNKDAARFDKKKVKCYKCSELGHFARECTGKHLDSKARYSSFKLKELDKSEEPKARFEKLDDQVKLEESKARFDKWKESSKNLHKLINSSMSTRTKFGLGFGETFGSDEVFDPSAPSSVDFKTVSETPDQQPSSTNDDSTNIPSFVPRAAYVPAGSRNPPAYVSAGREVPAGSRNPPASVSAGSAFPAGSRNPPASVSAGSAFPAGSRNRPASVSAGRTFSAEGELLLRPQQVVLGKLKGHICCGDPITMDNPHKNKNFKIVDSGCSRSMTSNKEKLDDFVKIIGGTVTFGGGDGKITGKGTIRTSKLNFENVYYVEELQNFNLFSVSQIVRY
ncbi:ribonuclease H-like domain-containing protein, partial [Tanacetum coccineum]